MAYATYIDVQDRLKRTLSEDDQKLCTALLEDAAVLIDAINKHASEDAKKIVSCRMVIRAIGSGDDSGNMPIGATQGTMSALGYSQTWTFSGGSVGQIYIDKTDKKYLGCGSKIGMHSPLEDIVDDQRRDNNFN